MDSAEKDVALPEKAYMPADNMDMETADQGIVVKSNPLARKLKGRHMQMIAIGTARLDSIARSMDG